MCIELHAAAINGGKVLEKSLVAPVNVQGKSGKAQIYVTGIANNQNLFCFGGVGGENQLKATPGAMCECYMQEQGETPFPQTTGALLQCGEFGSHNCRGV